MVRAPPWWSVVRRRLVVDPVMNDPRSVGDTRLGFSSQAVFDDIIRGGQADFTRGDQGLSADDLAVLYAFFNQPRHFEELTTAFHQLFGAELPDDLVVLDVGCGPATGALALAAACGPDEPFRYVAVDRAPAMLALGPRMIDPARALGAFADRATVSSYTALDAVVAPAPAWPPVLVVASYLLASPTLEPTGFVDPLAAALDRFGRGPVTLLCTNATGPGANAKWPACQARLSAHGFRDDVPWARGTLPGRSSRAVSYALMTRQARTTLPLPR